MRISIIAAGRARAGMSRLGPPLRAWAVGAVLLAPGAAWAAIFKQAPGVDKEGEAASTGPDTILGLIHVNTAFFIAIGILAVAWFLFGGGRKAKLGRKAH